MWFYVNLNSLNLFGWFYSTYASVFFFKGLHASKIHRLHEHFLHEEEVFLPVAMQSIKDYGCFLSNKLSKSIEGGKVLSGLL